MKRISCYSYYDKEGERWDTPFFAFNDLMAERNFRLRVSEEGTILHKFKDAFELYKVGEFDVEEGKIIGSTKLRPIITGLQIKEEK